MNVVLAINLEGGIIQSVGIIEGDLPATVIVIDYDTDGVDEISMVAVPQEVSPDGTILETVNAVVSEHYAVEWNDAIGQWLRSGGEK